MPEYSQCKSRIDRILDTVVIERSASVTPLSPTENLFERKESVSIRQWKSAGRLWCDEKVNNGQVAALQWQNDVVIHNWLV
jgi:hypothetical protein